MLARKHMPSSWVAWNRRWGAPFGRPFYLRTRTLRHGTALLDRTLFAAFPSLRGPFGFQPNNTTREVEYPWAFHVAPVTAGLRCLDIGGGLGGFQFVLAKSGCEVVNVDPGEASHGRGWPVDAASIARLNRAFGTRVTLHNCFLEDAPLSPATFDRVFSISVIEHIPPAESQALMRRAFDLLRPGGLFVITLDLFLNLEPFSPRRENEFGTNASVRMLAEAAPFEIAVGDRAELYGYPEFSAERVLAQIETLFLGDYPVVPQLVVLRKP